MSGLALAAILGTSTYLQIKLKRLHVFLFRFVFLFISGFTFFVYLYHEPTINIVRKLLAIPFGQTSFSFAFSYLISPWIFIAIAIMTGYVLKKHFPTFYSIIVGGR